MAHYAELNENNEVIYVSYLDNEIITDENGNEVEELGIQHLHTHNGSHRRWIRTSYGGNFRGKYAGIGDVYNEEYDIFVTPPENSSWILNPVSGIYEAPFAKPENEFTDDYEWLEESQTWFSIREYVHNTYAKDYDYDYIKNAVEYYNLKDNQLTPVTFGENYVATLEKVKNFILCHQSFQKWSYDVLCEWEKDYVEILSKTNCDLFAIKKVVTAKEKRNVHTFMKIAIKGSIFLEDKNDWVIYKYVAT